MVRPRKDGQPPAPCKSPEGRPEIWTVERIEEEAEAFLKWIERPSSIWMKDFALERKYSSKMYDLFGKKSKKFLDAHEQVKEWQESKFFRGALIKKFNQPMAMAALQRHHDWKSDNKIQAEELADAIQRVKQDNQRTSTIVRSDVETAQLILDQEPRR